MVLKNLRISLNIVVVLWVVFFINLLPFFDLRTLGIVPRNLIGLRGILFSPFLHADIYHLMANSSALFVLSLFAFAYSNRLAVKAFLFIVILGGLLVWIFGSPGTIHIGASGVIFGLVGFLTFIGIFRREWKALIVSIAVLFLYGGTLLTLLVYIPGISWAGHFFGFTAGVIAAWKFRNGRA